MSRLFPLALWALAAVLASALPAAADDPSYTITIQNHRFEPTELRIPANTRVRLTVRNLDPTPEEFESYELHREKIIPGNASGSVFAGPLKPGTYPFFGEFHQDTAQGRIVVE